MDGTENNRADVGGNRDDGWRLPAEARAIVPLYPYQRADVESERRFRWSCWARQTGKSFTKSLRRIVRGLARRRTQLFLSAGERQSRELMIKARQHCQAMRIAAELLEPGIVAGTRFKQLEIELPGGVRIIGLPANPETVRGFTGDVFLDEFAMHADDRQIWAAMFPTLLRDNGELDVASTPMGVDNVFAKLRDNEAFEHSTVTLPDAVAQGLNVDVEEIRRGLGDDELFRQEFLCEFLDEATAYLTYEQIAACEDAALDKDTPLVELAKAGEELFTGVDVGRRHDFTVIWVVSRRGDAQVTRCVIEMRGEPFREQYARLRRILELRNLRRCCIDAGGLGMQLAESAAEDFGRHRVEPVVFTAALKSQLAGRLRIAVEDRAIRIPVDTAIRNDWHAVRRTVSEAGHVRLDASRGAGGHGDRFWAAALALHAAGDSCGPAEAIRGRPLRYARPGIW